MTIEFITLAFVFSSCGVIAHYLVRYAGWKYKAYHQDDLQKTYAATTLTIALMVILIIEMAH